MKKQMKKALFFLFVLVVNNVFAQNTLQLPPIYTDNMVLQRNIPLKINGNAVAGQKITLNLKNRQYTGIAGNDGKWEITVDPMEAGGPYTLQISTLVESLTFSNIMIGEVWLCSGQSNMAFPLKQDAEYEKIKNKLDHQQIRFFHMKPRWETQAVAWRESALDSLNNFDYFKETNWEICTQSTAKEFSAIAYSFGKMLTDSLNVPVGLILNAVGGSPIESWISREKLETNLPDLLTDWTENRLIQDWVRERAALNISKSANKDQNHPYKPGFLFRTGIQPLHQYPINGIIWYQGESNVHDQMSYDKLFPLLVNNWREWWNNGKIPFLYVQLSSIDRPLWPEFRDIQRKFMQTIPYTYMAVSSDMGDSLDVHPIKKQEIGRRLGLWALNKNYGRTDIIPSGPLYRSVEFHGPFAYLSFDYSPGMHTSDKKGLQTFEVAEADGLYHQAEAAVEKDRIKVWSGKVEDIHHIRYGWQPYTRANLVNEANLPASTFKTQNTNMEINQVMKRLPDYPVKGGISAPFTGVHQNRLIVVGGCNFPDTPASEGGKKVFYSEIYTLDLTKNGKSKEWKRSTPYPYKVAYGAYVNTPDGLICIGGQNEEGALSNVTLIQYNEEIEDVVITPLPPLPVSHYNGDAVMINNALFVTGGVPGNNQNAVYCLHLHEKKHEWKEIKINATVNRQQPVLFAQQNQLFLTGGYDEENAIAFTDVMKFDFEKSQWEKYDKIMPQADSPTTFIGSGSVNLDSDRTLFAGGVNYERFSSALQRIKKTKDADKAGNTNLVDSLKKAEKKYMSQTSEWYRFQPSLITYDCSKKQWKTIGKSTRLARAGAGICLWGNKLYVIGGELKPGIRTEEASCFDLKKLGLTN